jgi:hypothetical protein
VEVGMSSVTGKMSDGKVAIDKKAYKEVFLCQQELRGRNWRL